MSLIQAVKSVTSVAQKLGDLDLRQKLLDIQGEALELMEQLKEKDAKIEQLEKALLLKGKMIHKGSAYYLTDDSGEIVDGPFCTKCFTVDHIQCHLIQPVKMASDVVQCQKCKSPFQCSIASNYLYQAEKG